MRRNRSSFSFPDFSLRRLLLHGARAARGSPTLGSRCDIEKGTGSSSKGEKSSSTPSNKYNNNDTTSQCSGTTSSHVDRISFVFMEKASSPKCRNKTPPVSSQKSMENSQECQLCYMKYDQSDDMYTMLNCKHTACRICLESYLTIEITESRTDIACPQCAESMHPSDIQILLKTHPNVISKYEDFMVRRVLLADPDSRWCPAPDCSYAVIATGCASCPRLRCERPGCDLQFCYHCKAEWHPDQTCDAARAARHSPTRQTSGGSNQDPQNRDDIKPCPRCQVLIVKIDDGSCNHMVCAVCGSEFCWLCKKEITDLHYLSPSGCTFWGTKPWSRKKKLLWQLGTLVGAPVMIALVAGIAVPAMIIGIPVWVGRKLHTRYKGASKHKRNCAVMGGVAASMLVSPVLAGLAVAIGVPILLFYVYGVVPVSLCRAGCGVSTSRDGVKFEFDEDEETVRNHDTQSVDAVSRIGATSIGEVSLSVASASQFGGATNSIARESTTALAGSINGSTAGHKLEVQADISETASAITCVSEKSANNGHDTASTKALAGSILNYRHVNAYDQSLILSEDTTSERVRFDNMIYVLDGQKEGDCWYTAPLDQEMAADKASLSSARSFRSSDLDSTSITSMHKRMAQRTKLQHRAMSIDSNSGSNNIPESPEDAPTVTFSTQECKQPSSGRLTPASSMGSIKSNSKSPQPAKKGLSKSNILRNIFFSGSSNSSKS
ncbi:CLUMA_CG018058, isoform A [Clunio marinus]|nr:CLUMA_CG018058, isoform A [Clunio marinus]